MTERSDSPPIPAANVASMTVPSQEQRLGVAVAEVVVARLDGDRGAAVAAADRLSQRSLARVEVTYDALVAARRSADDAGAVGR